jgi:hypothetical protein
MNVWVWWFGEILMTGENRSTRRKPCLSATLSTKNPTRDGLILTRPATDCLNHGKAREYQLSGYADCVIKSRVIAVECPNMKFWKLLSICTNIFTQVTPVEAKPETCFVLFLIMVLKRWRCAKLWSQRDVSATYFRIVKLCTVKDL